MAERTTGRGAKPKRALRLFLVGPRSLVGMGIRRALEQQSGFEVVAEAPSTEDALPLLGAAHPDVIVVDLRLLETDGAQLSRRFREEAEDAAVVVVAERWDAGTIFEALELGATAHVADAAGPSDLASAIQRAAGGEDALKEELVARPDLVEDMIDAMRDAGRQRLEPGMPLPLTPRELEILEQVARGLRNREIADETDLTEQTVKNHMTSILRRLGVPNRTLAVAYAVQSGWIDPSVLPAPEPSLRARVRPFRRSLRPLPEGG
jgi:DNA-binding NarL/FixJ family response regulator